MPLDDRAVAISATFTAEAIQPGLAFWAGELGLDAGLQFAGFNQVFQELLDPAGLFARNRRGFNVALVRLDDWAEAGIADSVARFADAVRVYAGHGAAPLIVVECPSRTGGTLPDLNEGSVYLIRAAEIAESYPVAEVFDPHAEELGHLPYTPEYFAALATAIARKIHAVSAAPFKAIALDCDETLWSGICGEDGPEGVVLDEPRRALQEFMAARRREGMLLALCSKNNEADVLEVFAAHPEFPLKVTDFAARRVDWESKARGLGAIAAELDLGLDSLVLVDDNAKECTEAQAGAPEVLALALPSQPEEIPEFLRHVWAFDRPRVTEEDRRRADMYTQQAARTRAQRAAGSLREFLASLELEIEIASVRPEDLARVAQLTQRTNQMNTSLVRLSEAEVRAFSGDCLTVRVRDRFGDYGLTGAMLFHSAAGTLVVDAFLLSCRALGRGVEHRMMARLGEIALSRGLQTINVTFVAGKRNQPAAAFLASVGNPLSASAAAATVYEPSSSGTAVGEAKRPSGERRRLDYWRIATELRRVEDVMARIRGAAAKPAREVEPPRTPLERDLAELWAGLLNVSAVGIHDNFFDLGGHSLLAVQLLSRVRQIYGVELSLEVVYSGEFTVAELAKAVELKEIEQSGGDYQELLRELEGLSDDEVRALLAEEQDS